MIVIVAAGATSFASAADGWKAGTAETVITPDEFLWMSGYGGRTAPADGKNDDLMCKAVVLEDPAGERVVLVTLDLVGIDRATSSEVCRTLEAKFGLQRRQVALNTSHTHCGPVVGTNLKAMYSISPAQWKQVERYTAELQRKIVRTVGQAIAGIGPAQVSWGTGTATFAVNRRENAEAEVPKLRAAGTPLKGPIDHSVPVLAVRDPTGKLCAVVFGYACHATTLGFQKWCADYPGYAYRELQRANPGSIALFWAGCGADQNPIPRRTVELAETYGKQLAAAVGEVLSSGAMRPIAGSLASAYAEVDLELAHLPDRAELESTLAKGNRYEQGRARLLLDQLAQHGRLSPTYPYPVQTWRLGASGPRWVLLGGEVVVDYVLRLKQELGTDTTWVAGYTNDVPAYIPSRRVLAEGRYEGATSMVYYGLPSPWKPMLEEAIVGTVRDQAAQLAK